MTAPHFTAERNVATDSDEHHSSSAALRGRILPRSWEIAKRAMDIAIASAVLLLTAPLVLVAMATIVITSPGSPIFAQHRVGRHGKKYLMFKLRTMFPDAHLTHQPLLQKAKKDPRVLPIGYLLRKTSIDELPNLVNVLLGEMSVVGPRPMLANEIAYCVERHGESALRRRQSVKPGITGSWQISGRANLHFDDRVKLDVRYADTWTPAGDVHILLRTIPVVLFARGAY